MLALVKPQFELERSALNKQGVVKDHGQLARVKDKITSHCRRLPIELCDFFSSELKGRDGNQEFFLYAIKKPS